MIAKVFNQFQATLFMPKATPDVIKKRHIFPVTLSL